MKEIEWNRTSFINDFQRKRYERAKLSSEKLKQNPLTAEEMRAKCKRLSEQVKEAKEREKSERKSKK